MAAVIASAHVSDDRPFEEESLKRGSVAGRDCIRPMEAETGATPIGPLMAVVRASDDRQMEDESFERGSVAGRDGTRGSRQTCASTQKEVSFAEAMQAVEEMQAVASRGLQINDGDRIDAMLLEELEEDDCGQDEPDPAAGLLRKPGTGLLPTEIHGVQISVQPSGDERACCRCASSLRDWSGWLSALALRLFRELFWALVLLASPIAVIARQAPAVIDPLLATLQLANSSLVAHDRGFADDRALYREGREEIYVVRDVILLMLRPLYALALARLSAISMAAFFGSPRIQRLLPGLVLLVLHSIFYHQWSLPAMLFPALCGLCRLAVRFDKAAWQLLFSLPLFLPMSMWLMSAGLSLALLDAAVQLWQNHLKFEHYETRSEDAYEMQRALRKIAAAIRASGARHVQPSKPKEHRGRMSSSLLVAKLQAQLQRLAGPMDLSSDCVEAATMSQARRRAARLFTAIVNQSNLPTQPLPGGAEGGAPTLAVDRDVLVAWAFKEGRPPSPKLAAKLFCYGQMVDSEHFVKVVERSFKEKRLLTASVASFDRLHDILTRALQSIWAFVIVLVLLLLWGVELVTWLLPIGSALIVFTTLAGGLTIEVVTSFFFVYVIRPYDIGDRVCLSEPGQSPVLFSLIVKDIFLMRTHFLTCNGESMMMNNSTLKGMALTNLSRSGKLTLHFELMVPVATPSAKINELMDAIKSYVQEKSCDWSAVGMMFSAHIMDRGHLLLNIWPTSVYAAHECSAIYSAKSRLLLFCHAYMQSADIEYLFPVLPTRHSPGRGIGPAAEPEAVRGEAADFGMATDVLSVHLRV